MYKSWNKMHDPSLDANFDVIRYGMDESLVTLPFYFGILPHVVTA